MRVSLLRKKYLLAAFVVLLCGWASLPLLSYAENKQDSAKPFMGFHGMIHQVSMGGLLDHGAIKSAAGKSDEAVRNFYDAHNNMPVWTNSWGHSLRAQGIHKTLQDSWKQGLNPKNYNVEEIERLLQPSGRMKPQNAELEILLTESIIAYGRDVTGMRVDPKKIGQKNEYWRQPLTAEEILKVVSAAPDAGAALEALGPQSRIYKALQNELVRLQTPDSDYDALLPLKFGGANIFLPGDSDRDVIALRKILNVPAAMGGDTEMVYDKALVEAVMNVQQQAGLKPDGKIGAKTRTLLNKPMQQKIDQVLANLERLRWMEQTQPEKFVLVNIPSQMLWAIDNEQVVHAMPVVVGQVARPTQSFKTEITGIRFNPTWTVPPSIKVKDMLPRLQADPYDLAKTGIDLYMNGKLVDPGTIDWNLIPTSEVRKIRMVQSAGDDNALGQVRVLMPNEYDIYLHDTNHRDLFAQDDRFFSSGCIRMSEPHKIADFVLSKNKGWSVDKMMRYIDAGKTAEISAAEKIPVYIVYQSMWLDDKGRLVYGNDIYNLDKKLVSAMAAINGLPELPQIHKMTSSKESDAQKLASARN